MGQKKDIKRGKTVWKILYPVFSVGIILLIWLIGAKIKNNALVLPEPRDVIVRFGMLFVEKNFYKAIGVTLVRAIVCFAVSFTVSLCLALLSYRFDPIYGLLAPIVSILRSAPTVAVILVFYAFFSNELMTFVVGFLIAFPSLYSAHFSALEQLDKDLVSMAKVYKADKKDILSKIYLPYLAPFLFDSAASTLSLTLKVVVAAEILSSARTGLGGKIQTAYASFEISYLLAWTIVAILLSFLSEKAIMLLKKAVIRWEK